MPLSAVKNSATMSTWGRVAFGELHTCAVRELNVVIHPSH